MNESMGLGFRGDAYEEQKNEHGNNRVDTNRNNNLYSVIVFHCQ